jgi:signal transduction histidine kinase
MNLFMLAPFFGAAANIAVAIFVFSRNPRQRLNQIYLLWGCSLAIWCAGAGVLFFVESQADAAIWARLLHFGVIWIPVCALHVCLLVARMPIPRLLQFAYAATVLLTIGNALSLHIGVVRRMEYGWFATAGWGFWIFSALMPCFTVPAVVALVLRRRTVEKDQKPKFNTLIAANSLLLIMGSHDLAPVLGWSNYPGTNWPVYPWGTYVAGLYGFLVAYGVLQDQALDVRVTLSRHAATIVRLVFFFAVSFLLLFVASALGRKGEISIYAFAVFIVVMVLSATVTGVLFPKLFGGAGEMLERRLLGDHFEYQEKILALADTIHRYPSLEEMWQRCADTLTGSMKVAQAKCLLLGARKFAVAFRGSATNTNKTEGILASLGADCEIMKFFASTQQRMLDVASPAPWVALGSPGGNFNEARAEAQRLGAEYVFALSGSERVFGFLAIGSKPNHSPFTAHDLELILRLAQRMGWATERTVLASHLALAETHEVLSLMSRGLAHDVNNMLTPVSTFVQLSAAKFPKDSVDGPLRNAADKSLRVIRDYVEEVLFFSRDLQPRMTEISLPDLLDGLPELVASRAARRGVDVKHGQTVGTAMVDGVLCQRLLTNLLANAIDASSSGQSVVVDAKIEASRGVVKFRIQDQGAGIAAEQIPMVFQPYYTTKGTGEHDELRGYGLGLTICQLIVELHGGVISIESKLGSGTIVTVELPVDGGGQPAKVPTFRSF